MNSKTDGENAALKRSSPKFQRFLRPKLGDRQKKRKKKGLQASHADFIVSFELALLKPMGPLVGPLKSMGPGVIVPPAPPLSVALHRPDQVNGTL